MANLSNINNILRTGSLGVGINRDPLGAFEISSATKPGIKMFNTAASGKTYEAYSDANGNYIIYDQDADDNRLVINSAGNATFAGSVTITGGTTNGLNITTSGTQDTININRAANNDNAITKYQTASVDKWIVGLRNTGDDNFRFYSYGTSTDVLTIDQTNGNVGIGQTPYSYSRLSTEGSDNTSSNYAFIAYNQNTDAILACRNDGNVTMPSGNVGIGRTPDVKILDLQSTSGLALRFYNSATFKAGIEVVTTAGQMIGSSAVNDLAIRSQSNMLFATGGNTEGMRIDSSGDTHLQGNLFFEGSTSYVAGYSIRRQGANFIFTGGTTGTFFNRNGNGATDMYINASGNVGIGTTSEVAEKLNVNGNIITVGGSTNTGYDRYLKLYGNTQPTGNPHRWAGLAVYNKGGNNVNELAFFTGSGDTARTEKMRITSTGAISVGSTGTAYGASGEVLTSNGNASPSWQAAGGSSPFGQALKTYSTSANVVVATTVNASTVASKVSGHIIITVSTGGGIITKTIGIYETSNLWFYDLATPEIENSNNSIVIAPSGNATNTLTFTVGVTNPVAGYGMTVSIQASPPGFFNL